MIGSIGGAILFVVVYYVAAFLLAGGAQAPEKTPMGPTVFFAAFGLLFGWLWGVGSFSPYSHEHAGFEHHRDEKPGLMAIAVRKGVKTTPDLIRLVRPLIRPLMVAIGISAIILLVLLLATTVLGSRRGSPVLVQTDKPEASVTTTAGDIILPFGGPDGTPVNKTVFFGIIVLLVLGMLAVTAIVLALIMNTLSREVVEAKQAPPEPPQKEPPLFRLINFFVTWIDDILEGTKRTISR